MSEGCYIVADVGGTNVRFGAAHVGEDSLWCKSEMSCAKFAQFDLALEHYVDTVLKPAGYQPIAACIAVAGAVHSNPIQLTNSPWCIDRTRLVQQLRCPVFIINDFAAQASYLPALRGEQLHWLRPPAGRQHEHQVKVIVGPGTGLGAAACMPSGEILAMEAGNSRFNPTNDLQNAIAQTLAKSVDYIPVEQVVSGPGLAIIYSVLAHRNGLVEKKQPAEITAGALAGDKLCLKTVAEFSGMLGAVCGDIALTLGGWGGVYLSGGVLNKLGNLFSVERFLSAFSTRGHFSEYCQSIPIAKILVSDIGLQGALRYLQLQHPHEHVLKHDNNNPTAIGDSTNPNAQQRLTDGVL